MKKSLFLLFLSVAAVVVHFVYFYEVEVVHAHGILAPGDPVQKDVSGGKPFMHKDFVMTPLADFSIQARVLSRKNYYFGDEARLCPVDMALGWGLMSDTRILEHLEIWQRARFYFWKAKSLPVPPRDIQTHSSNMHLIPANKEIEKELKSASKGNIIQLSGKLVRVNSKKGWYWKSSMSRADTGAGACEVVYVESFSVVK